MGAFVLMAALAACQRTCGGSATAGLDGSPEEGAARSKSVGVSECDDYLAKYERCISSKVPGDRRKVFEDSLERTRTTWKALAANSGARPGLPQACRLALETARTTMQQFACGW